MKPKILIVDDEKEVLRTIRRYLEARGFRVLTAENASAALAMAEEALPDLVITDVSMPDMDGKALCRLLKKGEKTGGIPIIMVSGSAMEERSVVAGLDEGADDYMLKPISFPILLSRINAVLRRSKALRVEKGGRGKRMIEIDIARRTLKVAGDPVTLTRKEFDLLVILIGADGRVLSSKHLLEEVWGYDLALYNNPHTVEVHISSLRKKLGPKGAACLESVSGVGYKFEEPRK